MTRERELLAQADQYIAEYKTRIARQRESIASEDPFIMVAPVTKTDRNSASAVSTALMTCMLYLAPAVFPQSDSLGELLVGKAAFGDWCTAAPLVRREITELPPPYATRSVSIKRNASASDPNVNFYSDSACSSTVTTFNLSGRTAMGQFFFKDGSASSITINLSLLNLLFASQSETILNSAPQPSPSPAPAPAASPAPAPIPTPSLNGITLNAVATAPHTYSTNFPTTDPSLSERGVWKTGVDPYQTAVAVTSEGGVNIAHGTQTGSNRPYAPYDDSSAYLTGFSRNHMIQGTVWKDPTLTGVSGFEIELLLSWGASYPTRSTSYGNTHSNGYEINVAYDGSYFIVGRFKGDALQWRSLSPPKTGDKFAAQIVHNSNGSVTIKTWWNGILKHNYTDTTPVPSGNPGIGFFVSDGNADNRFGFSSITAANVGSEVDLSWSAVSGAVSYKIIRNGTQIDTSTTNTYVDAGLSSGTTYSYEVQAIDQSGNAIANSNTATTTAN